MIGYVVSAVSKGGAITRTRILSNDTFEFAVIDEAESASVYVSAIIDYHIQVCIST